jgi:hypothetical protein
MQPGNNHRANREDRSGNIPSYPSWGGPFYLSCSVGWRSPKSVQAHRLQAASVQPVTSGMRGPGRAALLWLLSLLFLSGCASPPRLVQGDSTSMSWYAKTTLTKF